MRCASTGIASLDLLMITAAAGFIIGVLNITGLSFALTLLLVQIGSGQSVAAADPGGDRLHHSRHGHADRRRLCAAGRPGRAGDGQDRSLAHGLAHVRDVFRHDVDDHAAGRARRLRRRFAGADRSDEDRLDRDAVRLDCVHHSVPIHTRALAACSEATPRRC